MSEVALALRNIRREFGETIALDDVSLEIRTGEILCLLGENGAGKTTLMRIAAGIDTPSSGSLFLDGTTHSHLSSRQAAASGIALVHQHFLLVPEMTIEENLALADATTPFVITPGRARAAARAATQTSGLGLGDTSRLIASLSVGEMSRVELVKALRRRPRILILDEPTSVLSPPEVEELGHALRSLSAAGTAVVLITHKLAEVFALADRVAVLRGGKLVHDSTRSATSAIELARIMTGGRELAPIDQQGGRAPRPPRERSEASRSNSHESRGPWRPAMDRTGTASADFAVLALESVTTADGKLRGATMQIASGEILAIVGVAGNGQRELAQLLRGLSPFEGKVMLLGRDERQRGLASTDEVAHIPEDRSNDGICADMTLEENIALSNLSNAPAFSIRGWQRTRAEKAIADFSIRTRGPLQKIGTLSGGNQQKVILARELAHEPRLIVAAEPTRGLDLEATRFVHLEIERAVAGGAGVLILTSDLDEAFELADAIHVIYRGELGERMTPPFAPDEVGEQMAGLR